MTADKLTICERLEAEEEVFQGSFRFVNPDGPEAAAIITELYAQLSGAVGFLEKAIERNLLTFAGEMLAGAIAERADSALAKVRTPHHPDEGGRP